MKEFEKSTRLDNLKKFPPAEENFKERLPWGANEIRIKRHVINTIEKLNKIRNPSRSSSKSPKKRDRGQVGLEFLDKLSDQRV